MPINTKNEAAVILRCPEGFELLCEGFRQSEGKTTEEKLDDALKHVASPND